VTEVAAVLPGPGDDVAIIVALIVAALVGGALTLRRRTA